MPRKLKGHPVDPPCRHNGASVSKPEPAVRKTHVCPPWQVQFMTLASAHQSEAQLHYEGIHGSYGWSIVSCMTNPGVCGGAGKLRSGPDAISRFVAAASEKYKTA